MAPATGGTRWRKLGTYPSVALAAEAMDAEREAGATGDWFAGRAGRHPDPEGAVVVSETFHPSHE